MRGAFRFGFDSWARRVGGASPPPPADGLDFSAAQNSALIALIMEDF